MVDIYNIIKESEHLFINDELCTKCKGICCKLTPCSYFPQDLDMSKEGLSKLLKEGKSSIKVKIMGFREGSKVGTVPILTVSARGRKKDAIDLLSPSVRCVALGSNGCELESKPTGAKILIPGESGFNSEGLNPCYNLLGEHQQLVLFEWMKYYHVLLDTVEDFSQSSFEDLYLRDLLATTITLLTDPTVSEYNKSSLLPILENMQLLMLFRSGRLKSKNDIINPSRKVVNYLNPSEEIYQRVRKFINK